MKNPKIKALEGMVFNRIEVVRFSHIENGNSVWLCKCHCGKLHNIHARHLGVVKSCGCERFKIVHGMARTPTYSTWLAMIQRCENSRATRFNNYGGRGIKVCKRWRKSFTNFFHDMGKRPPGFTIERKNVNGNYTKKNCIWADRFTPANNTTQNRIVILRGVKKTAAQWSRELGIPANTIRGRLFVGKSDSESLLPIDTIHSSRYGYKPIAVWRIS